MKKNIITSAAFLAASSALFAQSLTITHPGYTSPAFFTASTGYSVTGLTSDGLGNVFYLESDFAFSGTLSAKLWSRPFSGGGFGAPTLLHDFGANLNGNFLTFHSGLIYGGENTTGSLFALAPDGTGFDPLGTVSGHYDGAFSGAALYLSHAAGGNKVSRFTLGTDGAGGQQLSAGTIVLTAGAQASGPLEFGDAGELLYGSSSNGVYRYASAEVGAGGLTLDAAHRVVANGINSYLANAGGAQLWQDSYDSEDLHLIDTTAGTFQTIGTAGTFQSLGSLEFAGGTGFVVVSDYGTNGSRVFAVTAAPEPSAALLLLTSGLAALTLRRRHRQD